jgi:hypothetical protein
MPIEAPAGTLEVENAKFRASSVEATNAVGIGTDSNDAYPLQVFKETAPDIRISEGSTISSAARLYSNNSNLYIQTGADFTAGSSGDVAFQTMGGQSTHMVIKSDGKVGVGVADPQDTLHVYGAPIIQHDTRRNIGAAAWYKIGTWDVATSDGARLKISLLGGSGYGTGNRNRGGETIIYASINNNDLITLANIEGLIETHGKPVTTSVKFKQVGTDRTKYEIHAYIASYTQHSMSVECSGTTTFTKEWVASSDPGNESSTVSHAVFSTVVNNSGNVGIGTTNPLGKAHIYVDDAASGTQLFIENASTSNRTGLTLRNGDGEDFRIQHTSGSSNAAIIENFSTVNGGISFYAKGDGDHEFRTTNSNNLRMIIDNGGNVGIGVANPSQKLDVNGTIYASGSIVQVQSLTTTASYSTTASAGNGQIPAAYNTGVKLSITPKKNTSKILVNFNFLMYFNGQTTANGGRCQIFRKINSANRTMVYGIGTTHDLHYYAVSPSNDHIYINISFVDAPNTTGVCEYELASMMYTGGGTLYIGNGGNQPVTIQLMEIGA